VKNLVNGACLGMVVCVLAACASLPQQWQVSPPVQKASNKWVDITLRPVLDERYTLNVGYTGMVLEVRNKTNQDVTINWDETFYLQAGAPNRGFSVKGSLDSPHRGFDVILAGENYVKTIYPVALADVDDISRLSDPKLDWAHKPMPVGENGIVITLDLGFEQLRERLTFAISN
jgi:hypothetical protein